MLVAPDRAQAADQLRFHSVKGEWAVTSGVADDEIGKVKARGVRKAHIRYSIEGVDGFSVGRRSGSVSYDGTPIAAAQVSLTITARDARGEAGSASRELTVSVSQPAPPPDTETTPEPAAAGSEAGPGSGSEDRNAPAAQNAPDPGSPEDPAQEEDNVAPTVSSLSIVSTPAAHGSYAAGETITIEVTFSEPVLVTGKPCLLINVGDIYLGNLDRADEDRQKRPAAYVSGSGTSSLRFSYKVVTGDRDRRGVGVHLYGRENLPLRLRCPDAGTDGTIRDAADNDASLAHRWLWPDAGHKVGGPDVYPDDRTSPTVTGMEVVSSPESGDTYRDRETILVEVTFSEPVVVGTGTPRMGVWMGRYRKEMTYRGGSGTNKLILGYRIRSDDRDGDGIATYPNMILVHGDLAVTDSADNDANLDHEPMATQAGHKVAGSASDTTPPTVESVGIASGLGTYAPGQEIRPQVILSELARLEGLGGVEPSLEFTIGGETRTATYAPFNRPTTSWLSVMTFTYTVQEGDEGAIAIGADSVRLPIGASLRDGHDNQATSLTHPALDTPGYSVTSSTD